MTVVAVNCNDKQVLEVAVMVVVVNYIEPGEVVAMEMVVDIAVLMEVVVEVQ